MTVVIPDPSRPETLIQFSVDIGNGAIGAENNYVQVHQNGSDLFRWELGLNANLDAVDESGTIGSLIVQAGGVIVIDDFTNEENFLFVVDISTQQAVAAPIVPGFVPQPGPPAQPGDGLVYV